MEKRENRERDVKSEERNSKKKKKEKEVKRIGVRNNQ